MYIQNEDELALRNNEVAEQAEARRIRRDEGEDESDGDNEVGGGEPDSVFTMAGGVKPMKTKANPNLATNQAKGIKLKDLKSLGDALPQVDPTVGMNRKEREAVEAKKKHEEYMRRHLAGETDEAKREIAKLAEVRARREAAAAKRTETGRAPGWVMPDSSDSGSDDSDSDSDSADEPQSKVGSKQKKVKAGAPKDLGTMTKEVAEKKRAKAAAPASEDTASEKLSSMEIKKMNPNALKDALKARNLDIQGQKKDLMKRLADFEAAR
jgi:hypothetical protein